MGCCLSKNDPFSQSVPSLSLAQHNDSKKTQSLSFPVKVEHTKKQVAAFETNPKEENKSEEREEEEQGSQAYYPKKKEVFVIQHRKSNDKRSGGPDSDGSASNSSNSGDPNRETEEIGRNIMAAAANGQAVRTSSCTKEEVDAILIQCGRLSRSSSGKGNGNIGNGGHGRRYSGSKRSFDFDRENEIVDDSRSKGNGNGNEGSVEVDNDDERSRRRQSKGSHRRRTTPSRTREREQQQQQQKRSGSRERSQSNGRRISRSPNRRSESSMNGSTSGNGNGNVKPGKLVSVPATASSLSMEKANNVGNGGDGGNVKRVLVKRNVGSPRSQSPARASSPVRAHSPARGANQGNGNVNGANGPNGGTQQPASLSRNGSRRAEHSPYRRTPLNEIDINSLPFHPLSNKKAVNKGKEIEEDVVVVKQPILSAPQQKGTHRRSNSRGAEGYEVTKTNYCRLNELQTPNVDQMPGGDKRQQLDAAEYDAMLTPVVVSGTDTLKLPQTLMRTRSARRSRDLDINVEALLAPTAPTSTSTPTSTPTPATNYNSLLLQDIQNFHQKKNSSANANAGSSNNNSAVSSNNDAASNPFTVTTCISKANSILEAVADLNSTTGSNHSSLLYADERRKAQRETNFSYQNGNNKRADSKDPFVESEVKVGDDLMEPSMHKYVTVRTKGVDFNDDESSGSNSYVGGGNANQQNWVSSSSWEPTSADSTDCWTSHSYSREDLSPVAFQRHAISDFASGINEEPVRKLGKGGVAPRARTMAGKGPISSTPKTATVSM